MTNKILNNIVTIFLLVSLPLTGYLLLTKHLIVFSNTDSLDYSIFLVTPNKEVSRNDLVTFRYLGENIYHYEKNQNFTKIVKCMSGDYLKTEIDVIEGNKYYCNDTFIGQALKKDMELKSISNFVYNGMLKDGRIFVIGTHKYSYDSRYWGLVNDEQIIGLSYGII